MKLIKLLCAQTQWSDEKMLDWCICIYAWVETQWLMKGQENNPHFHTESTGSPNHRERAFHREQSKPPHMKRIMKSSVGILENMFFSCEGMYRNTCSAKNECGICTVSMLTVQTELKKEQPWNSEYIFPIITNITQWPRLLSELDPCGAIYSEPCDLFLYMCGVCRICRYFTFYGQKLEAWRLLCHQSMCHWPTWAPSCNPAHNSP